MVVQTKKVVKKTWICWGRGVGIVDDAIEGGHSVAHVDIARQ